MILGNNNNHLQLHVMLVLVLHPWHGDDMLIAFQAVEIFYL